MGAKVPDLSDADLEERGQYPGEWFNEDRAKKRENRKQTIRDDLSEADVVGLVDSDTDGLACEVVLKEAHDNVHVIQIGGEYGFELFDAVSFVNENTSESTELVVADLAPDAAYSSFLASLASYDGNVSVYDHHNWGQYARQSIRTVLDTLELDETGDLCAAQVLQRERYPDAPDWLLDFLRATADHDLYVKEDERSDHLSTLSFVLDREEYVKSARENGADMLENEELRETYERAEKQAEERIQVAVEKAEWRTINGVTVAVTYFGCHQSRAGDRLLEDGADLAVILKPTLKVSFRSTEQFGDCSVLARTLGGGGHKTAAGAKLYHHLDEGFEETWEKGGKNAVSFIWGFLERELS